MPRLRHLLTLQQIRVLGWVTVAFTYFLVLVGGLVRITGSGTGCPDWPTCHGSIIPPFGNIPTMIEYSHRLTASVVSTLVLALAVSIFLWARKRRYLVPMVIAGLLLFIQIVLGGITVLYDLPQPIVTAHLGTALALFCTLIVIALLLGQRQPIADTFKSARRFARFTLASTILTYGLLLSGSNVRGTSATYACHGWPICDSSVVYDFLAYINLFHRFVAGIVGLFIIGTVYYAWRRRRQSPKQARIALASGILFAIQVSVGALIAMSRASDNPEVVLGFHLGLATAVWGCMVALTTVAYRDLPAREQPPQDATSASETPAVQAPPAASTSPEHEWVRAPVGDAQPALETPQGANTLKMQINAYVNLMKPHVTVLLLGVTLATMAIAAGGFPPLALVVATLFGGACAAASANAINCYFDRDIDQLMSRTRRRSIPAGRVPPRHALILGVALAAVSFADLALFANLLSAMLAFAGIMFYVFVYTLWLKRTSVQNIVIGGAAGAVPPLVGWAAVTHSVGLPAVWLFAIIFYWTPPHFWALALLIKNDYARAHIPMMPVVLGEKETKRQIVLYTLLLIAVTLILFISYPMGYLYLVSALALGAGFLYLAIRVLRDETKRWARTLFWYSNCYLALLFAFMVIGRAIG